MRVFLAANKAHVRARQHGMEEVAQFVILRIYAVLLEPDVHHARVVAQAFDRGGVQVGRRKAVEIAAQRGQIRMIERLFAPVQLRHLIDTEDDAVVRLA